MSEEHRFPCQSCGADLRFSPDGGDLVCDFCGAKQDMAKQEKLDGDAIEQDYLRAIRASLPAQEMEETRISHCPNCAADVTFDKDVHAAECPFCATPVVTDTGTHRHIKPHALVPFSIDESAAQKEMTRWLGKLWFAPNGLKEYARKGRKMSGLYTPSWTYDAATRTQYRGERGIEYSRTVRDGDKERTVTEVRWHRVSGQVSRQFDDVLVIASHSLPEKFRNKLGPWELKTLSSYSPEYLSGFRAEGYQIGLEEGFEEARELMDTQIRRDVKRDIGGDRQRIHGLQTQVSHVSYKHLLLPIWMAAYSYRGKSYRFAVNGATGKVVGERPWSVWKIAFAVVLAALATGAGLYLAEISQ